MMEQNGEGRGRGAGEASARSAGSRPLAGGVPEPWPHGAAAGGKAA